MIHPKVRYKQWMAICIFAVLVLLSSAWQMTSGDYPISFVNFFKTLIGQGEYTDTLILFDFRLPRMLITLLAGAALSMSGAIIQSLTHNPLAEPGILGINAGSGFAIALFIVIGHVDVSSFVYVLPLVSMVGGVLTAIFIFAFSYSRSRGMQPTSMILVGVGISAALSGASITLMSTFDKRQSEFIASWFAGNIWGDEWSFVIAFIPWILLIVPFLLFKSNTLNILHTSESVAKNLGIRTNKERFILLLVAVVLSSAAVSVAGSIAFIGLMGPHIAKSIVGPRHQMFLPLSIMIGGCLLSFSDTLGQVVLQPSGIPAGIVVAIIGAPYFLYLMYKTRSV